MYDIKFIGIETKEKFVILVNIHKIIQLWINEIKHSKQINIKVKVRT